MNQVKSITFNPVMKKGPGTHYTNLFLSKLSLKVINFISKEVRYDESASSII